MQLPRDARCARSFANAKVLKLSRQEEGQLYEAHITADASVEPIRRASGCRRPRDREPEPMSGCR